MMKISVLLVVCISFHLYGQTSACEKKPSIDIPGCSEGEDVSGFTLPYPGQYGNDTASREGYCAVYQLVVYYQEAIKYCDSVKKNRAASPLKWILNAKSILEYAKITKKYYEEKYDLITKNTNHEVMFVISKLSVIYCQYVLYAVVQIFKASLKVIIIDTMVQLFEFTLNWLQYGYTTISSLVKINYLIELVGYATKLSYAFAYKYYYYSGKCPSKVKSTDLFTDAVYWVEKMNDDWYTYVRDFKDISAKSPTFGRVALDLISVIEILYKILFRFLRVSKNFVALTTKDFYKATAYLYEIKKILEANPKLLDNPVLFRSVYCFLENKQTYQLIVYIGRLVAYYKGCKSTFIFNEAYISLKTSVDQVNKYCLTCQ